MLKENIHQPRMLHLEENILFMMTNLKTDSYKQKLNECAANLH